MKPDARKDNGGARPGAGRKPNATPKKYRKFLLTDAQYAAAKMAGGSPWLQGILNLLLTDRPGALVLLLIDELTARHGREWLVGLVEKINERAKP